LEILILFRSLVPFDCREPGWRAILVMESRPNSVRFDGSEIPSAAGVERRSQLFLTNRVRSDIGTFISEAQHVQGAIVFSH
jgi:hypothetical protein